MRARRPRLGHRRRAIWYAMLLLIGLLPLQWQVLARTPLGELRPFHLASLLFVGLFLRDGIGRGHGQTSSTLGPQAVVGFLIYSVLIIALPVGHGDGAAVGIQQLWYAIVGYCVFRLCYNAAPSLSRDAGHLIYAAPVALLIFSLFFYRSSAQAGVNIAATLRDAIIGADPGKIRFALFRATFASGGDEAAKDNLRHEIAAALLVAAYVSAWMQHLLRIRGAARAVVWVSIGLILGFTITSLSRSVIGAVALTAAVPVIALIVRGRVTRSQARVAVVAVSILVTIMVTPLRDVFFERFLSETGSYEDRAARLDSGTVDILSRFPVGGPLATSSHNMILDAWLRAGVLAAFTCAVFLGDILRSWLSNLRRYIEQPSWLRLLAIAAVTLPLVRSVTAGSGTLHLSQWIALGLGLGITADLRRRVTPRSGPVTSPLGVSA